MSEHLGQLFEVEVGEMDKRDADDDKFDECAGDGDWLLLDMLDRCLFGNQCRGCHMVTKERSF